MRGKRFIGLAFVAALVLAVAGIAVASNGGGKPGKTEAASATFTATPTDQSKTRTCTGPDGTYSITKGVYTGTSTGDPRLTGDIVIQTKSVVNQDNGLGVTDGTVWLKETGTTTPKRGSKSGKERPKFKAVAQLNAVNTQKGKLDGFLLGKAKNADGKGTTGLAANFSAAFNSDGSQLTGELGGGDPVAPGNSAVFFGRPCKPEGDASQYQQNGHGNDGDKGGRHGGGGHR